jgi:hypothetical protein
MRPTQSEPASHVPATLELLDDRLRESVREVWLPLLRPKDEDHDWDWNRLLDATQGRDPSTVFFSADALQSVVVTCSGQVQGMLISSLPSAGPPLSVLESLLYVEYICVAPWNRPRLGAERAFLAVGPSLMRHAIVRSVASERGGRIGLHSGGVAATGFYNRIGMANRGPDFSQDGYVYIEGDTEWAERFYDGRMSAKTAP